MKPKMSVLEKLLIGPAVLLTFTTGGGVAGWHDLGSVVGILAFVVLIGAFAFVTRRRLRAGKSNAAFFLIWILIMGALTSALALSQFSIREKESLEKAKKIGLIKSD